MNDTTDALRIERFDAVLALAAAHVPRRAAADARRLRARVLPPARRRRPGRAHARRPARARCCRTGSSARTREPGRPKVRVLSPTVAEHGWASRHSVIEIVNDDMPFLVDSTTTEINRQGLTLHLIVHPIFAVRARRATASSQSIRPRTRGARRAARVVDARRGRSAGRCRSSAPSWWPASSACSATCAPRSKTGSRCWRGCTRPSPSWSRAPASLPKDAGGREPRVPAMAGRRPLHAARLSPARPGRREGRGRAAARPRQRPRACCARPRRRTPSASFAALPPQARALARAAAAGAGRHQGQHALDRAPRPATPTTSA